MWWKILIIAVAVLFLLLVLFAIFEVELMLAPKSRFAKKINWNGPMPEPKNAAEKVCLENRNKIIERAGQWNSSTPHTELTIKTKDGLTLYGYEYLQKNKSHNWVILAHGFHSPEDESAEYGMYYFEKGYNVLAPRDRANGKSEGRYIGMGWLDKDDIIIWINKIVEKDHDAKIVLHGVSMGGATVMMVTGEKIPSNVVCAIEDCGYTSVFDEFAAQAKNVLHMPSYPIVPMCSVVSKILCKYSFKEASSVKQVKKSSTPTLFIHGANDLYVPTEMVYRNYDAAVCPKEIFVMPDAQHAMSKNQNPDLYWKKVFTFIDGYVSK